LDLHLLLLHFRSFCDLMGPCSWAQLGPISAAALTVKARTSRTRHALPDSSPVHASPSYLRKSSHRSQGIFKSYLHHMDDGVEAQARKPSSHPAELRVRVVQSCATALTCVRSRTLVICCSGAQCISWFSSMILCAFEMINLQLQNRFSEWNSQNGFDWFDPLRWR
jgi:hypothetical protein